MFVLVAPAIVCYLQLMNWYLNFIRNRNNIENFKLLQLAVRALDQRNVVFEVIFINFSLFLTLRIKTQSINRMCRRLRNVSKLA